MVFLVCGCERHHTGHLCERTVSLAVGVSLCLLLGGVLRLLLCEGHSDCLGLGVSVGVCDI